MDWENEQSQQAFLHEIVTDAQSLRQLAQETRATLPADHPQREQLAQAGQLLGQLIEQDVDFSSAPAKLREGVSRDQIHKSEFHIDLEAMTCTCPAGHTTANLIAMGDWPERNGIRPPKQSFSFSVATCAACPLRPQCIKTKIHRGRTVQLHPQEALLRQAQAFQQSPKFQPYRQMRQTVEHRLARLVQLGIRQALYFGRQKTLFQLLMAATVANLT